MASGEAAISAEYLAACRRRLRTNVRATRERRHHIDALLDMIDYLERRNRAADKSVAALARELMAEDLTPDEYRHLFAGIESDVAGAMNRVPEPAKNVESKS